MTAEKVVSASQSIITRFRLHSWAFLFEKKGLRIHRRQVYCNDPTRQTRQHAPDCKPAANRQDHETRVPRELRSASFEIEWETSATRPATPFRYLG